MHARPGWALVYCLTMSQQIRPLSPLRRFAGLLLFLAVVAGSIALGRYLASRRNAPPVLGLDPVASALAMMLGAAVAMAGAAVYGLVLLTACFTFNFRKP